jgi:hypothetical protein
MIEAAPDVYGPSIDVDKKYMQEFLETGWGESPGGGK